jgi:hypothetical protein
MTKKAQDRFGPEPDDLFERSRRLQLLGREELAKFPARDIAAAWLRGVAINLGSPAIILSPPVLALPHTGFYGTPGGSMAEKVGNFLFRSAGAPYAWVLLLGIAGVAVLRLVQLVGMAELVSVRAPLPVVALLAGWCAFILLVNGPIASPKYRLPIEPVLVLLTAAGFTLLRRVTYGQRAEAAPQRSYQA